MGCLTKIQYHRKKGGDIQKSRINKLDTALYLLKLDMTSSKKR
jgi:hypothetical protein